MGGMIVKGREYRFTTFLDRELSLVAERAAFPRVKALHEGFPNTARISPVRERSIVTRAYIKMQEPRLNRTLHAPAAHTGTPAWSLKPIGRVQSPRLRSIKASRARVLDRFSAETAQRVRVRDLWTRYVAKQVASYVRCHSSVRAIISSSVQEVGPTWPLNCGYHLRTGGVEARNDACHSA